MIHIKVGLMPAFKESNILMLEYEFVKQIYGYVCNSEKIFQGNVQPGKIL